MTVFPNKTVKCNFRKGNETFNFCAIMPKRYYKDEDVQIGVASVMAFARIEMGWKMEGRFLLGAIDVLHLAAARIGSRVIKKSISGRARKKKV